MFDVIDVEIPHSYSHSHSHYFATLKLRVASRLTDLTAFCFRYFTADGIEQFAPVSHAPMDAIVMRVPHARHAPSLVLPNDC